jgi:hypothetical protein
MGFFNYLIGLFVTNSAFVNLENYDLQDVFLSKTNLILTGKQCTTCSFFWTDGFL